MGALVSKLNFLRLPLVVLMILCSCTNIREMKFTPENRDKILSKLTPDERELLVASVMRQSISNAFGGPSIPPSTKTVGELIDDQRNWIAQQKTEEARQKRLAAEMAARQAALRNIITVALFGFKQKESFLSNYIAVDYAYENRSSKDVRAFEGRVVYRDVLGNELADTELKVLNLIKGGQKSSTSDKLYFITYGELRDKKIEDVKIEWQPTKVLFADGMSSESN